MKIRKSIPQSLPSNVVVLSPKKREELQLKRTMRELDNRYLPAITGVASVMLRGVSADIRFKTTHKLPRLWWMNLDVTITLIQTGQKFRVRGNQTMLVKDMAKDETLTIMKPVLPSANLGPEEFYKVEIKTFSGMTKNFVADRPQGKVHENANQINGNAVTPPKPHLVLVK